MLGGNRHLIGAIFRTSVKVIFPEKILFSSKSGRPVKDFVRFCGLTAIVDSQAGIPCRTYREKRLLGQVDKVFCLRPDLLSIHGPVIRTVPVHITHRFRTCCPINTPVGNVLTETHTVWECPVENTHRLRTPCRKHTPVENFLSNIHTD